MGGFKKTQKTQSTEVEGGRQSGIRGHHVPWLITLVVIPLVAKVLNALTTGNTTATAVTVAIGTGGGIILTWGTWHQVGAAHSPLRAQATLTVAWVFGVTTVCTITSPFVWPGALVWLLGGAFISAWWSIRAWLRTLGGSGMESTGGGPLGELAEKVGLSKARFGKAEIGPNGTVTQPFALPPGDLASDVQNSQDRLASGMDVYTGGAKVFADPASPRKGRMEITPIDHLAVDHHWPGPSKPGASIAEPVRAAREESGSDVMLNLTGGEDQISLHMLVTGMTGAGKTDAVVGVTADMLTRREVKVIVLDVMKAKQSWGFLSRWVRLVADPTTVKAIIKRLEKRVIKERTDYLGAKGMKDWRSGCGLDFLVIVIEEAYTVIGDAGGIDFDTVAKAARSAGISLVLSVQRATYNNLSTDVRAQLGIGWCFGTKDGDDATFTLPKHVLAAVPVDPTVWGNTRPGCSYLAGGGRDGDDALRPMRSGRVDQNRDQIAACVQAWQKVVATDWDPTTKAAFGELIEDLDAGCDPAPRPVTPPPVRPVASTAPVLEGVIVQDEPVAEPEDEETEDKLAAERPDLDETVEAAAAACLAEQVQADSDLVPEERALVLSHPDPVITASTPLHTLTAEQAAEIDPEPPTGPSVPTMVARDQLEEWLADRKAAGQPQFTWADVEPLVTSQLGRSREWWIGEMRRLVASGDVAKPGRGLYEVIAVPEPALIDA